MIRFGFVIVDDSRRGKGYGKRMLELGLEYAFKILKARKVTIGVFENNAPAYHCYKALGFQEVQQEEYEVIKFRDEEWKIIELKMQK